jgi:hypothetical protein
MMLLAASPSSYCREEYKEPDNVCDRESGCTGDDEGKREDSRKDFRLRHSQYGRWSTRVRGTAMRAGDMRFCRIT